MMTQYIYFVKCPDCEDEHFDFYDEAKEFALGCLSQKPVITQVEVCRNDFGECTDSTDLGTIWSWEDVSGVTEDEPATSVFTLNDLTDHGEDDEEFAALDNSLDVDCVKTPSIVTTDALDQIPDNYCPPDKVCEPRKPIPDGYTVEDLVEALEENEDTVECKWCNELFDRSEVRYEVDLGYLCDHCQAAIKSRGEQLTFREDIKMTADELKDKYGTDDTDIINAGNDGEKVVLKENAFDSDEIELYYDDLQFTYVISKDKLTDSLVDFVTDNDVSDLSDKFKTAEEIWIYDEEHFYKDNTYQNEWDAFLLDNCEELLERHEHEVLAYLHKDAEEAAKAGRDQDETTDDSDFDGHRGWGDYYTWKNGPASAFNKFESIDTNKLESMLEELEDTEDYHSRLTLCPECGECTFDLETGICINCGFNI